MDTTRSTEVCVNAQQALPKFPKSKEVVRLNHYHKQERSLSTQLHPLVQKEKPQHTTILKLISMWFSKNTLLLLLAGNLSSKRNMAEAQGQSLLGGRFETTTDVQILLNLALDVADMKEIGDWDQKKLRKGLKSCASPSEVLTF